jgi:hypothetical protein
MIWLSTSVPPTFAFGAEVAVKLLESGEARRYTPAPT